jgi:hypothetical protein
VKSLNLSKGDFILTKKNEFVSIVNIQNTNGTWRYFCREILNCNGDTLEHYISKHDIKAICHFDNLTSKHYLHGKAVYL